jgi:hypothetical protein
MVLYKVLFFRMSHMLAFCVSFHHCDEMPKKNNLNDLRFILAHGFRGFSPWWLGRHLLWTCGKAENQGGASGWSRAS